MVGGAEQASRRVDAVGHRPRGARAARLARHELARVAPRRAPLGEGVRGEAVRTRHAKVVMRRSLLPRLTRRAFGRAGGRYLAARTWAAVRATRRCRRVRAHLAARLFVVRLLARIAWRAFVARGTGVRSVRTWETLRECCSIPVRTCQAHCASLTLRVRHKTRLAWRTLRRSFSRNRPITAASARPQRPVSRHFRRVCVPTSRA